MTSIGKQCSEKTLPDSSAWEAATMSTEAIHQLEKSIMNNSNQLIWWLLVTWLAATELL